jgi:hypothetical protein
VAKDSVRFRTVSILYKFDDPDGKIAEALRKGMPVELIREQFKDRLKEVSRSEGNIFLNEGIEYIWKAVTGVSGLIPFDTTHACLGVGDGTASEDRSQTGLQGSNKYYKGMDAGYPQISGTTVTFRATFGPDEANFAWNEWSISNGPSDDYVNLNRKVEPKGTKVAGSTWSFTVQLTIS